MTDRPSLRGATLLLLLTLTCGSAATLPVFQTSFEASEGYSVDFDLENQLGWIGTTPGIDFDNGIFEEILPGLGQHAYIGLAAAEAGENAVFVWHPLDPIPPEYRRATFSVLFDINDSSNPDERDSFGWFVYNTEGSNLFSIELNNDDLGIYYNNGNPTNLAFTGFFFANDVTSQLVINMDFDSNLWNATVDEMPVVRNQPIGNPALTRNLGDVSAVWIYRNPLAPGDNSMLFDNYAITAISATQPILTNITRLPNRDLLLRVIGEVGERYAVEATTDFQEWIPLGTNTADGGFFDFVDETASDFNTSFYRAVLVP